MNKTRWETRKYFFKEKKDFKSKYLLFILATYEVLFSTLLISKLWLFWWHKHPSIFCEDSGSQGLPGSWTSAWTVPVLLPSHPQRRGRSSPSRCWTFHTLSWQEHDAEPWGGAGSWFWCSVLQSTYLEETSYLLKMTLHGTPATVTELWTSSALWPRFEPEIVTTVPPSTGPEIGSSWNTENP